MDKKTYIIGVLSVIAAILLAANLMPRVESQAQGAFAVKDRDYQMVAVRGTKGGEVLYVVDNFTGKMAVFGWDNGSIKPLVVQKLQGR